MNAAEKASRLGGLVASAEYLRAEGYLDLAAELTAVVNRAADELGYCRRFDEEKPPAAGTEAIG